MLAKSSRSWAGSRRRALNRGFARLWSGISRIRIGLRTCAPALTSIGLKPTTRSVSDDEGNCARGRFGDPPLSGHPRHFETAAAGVRQADDLLSADYAHARGYPGNTDHLDAAGYVALCGVTGRRHAV